MIAVQALCLLLGCGTLPSLQTGNYEYFEDPAPRDPWSSKIRGWQSREREQHMPPVAEATAPGAVQSGEESDEADVDLQAKYNQFRAEHRRSVAKAMAEWIQEQAQQHYVPDGGFDHWATLRETLAGNGDDCDGLELLVFNFLREMGLGEDAVYRAIVHRPSDGQHHMVTLWFEDPSDPWVIDPTGAMVSGMPRMSEVPGWVPIKLFSESREFTVRADTRIDLAARIETLESGAGTP